MGSTNTTLNLAWENLFKASTNRTGDCKVTWKKKMDNSQNVHSTEVKILCLQFLIINLNM